MNKLYICTFSAFYFLSVIVFTYFPSDPDTGRSSEEFQSIMKYLFEFVEKDKQAESLVEKLCHRLLI